MNILLTLGATAEPVDGVRFITNLSTGKTGCALADGMAHAGHDVLALCGQYAQKPRLAKTLIFTDFADLNRQMRVQLGARDFDAVIHLAAVSDFSVSKVIIDGKACAPAKLKKIPSGANIMLELKNNFKIIDRLKKYAKNDPFIIGFKLTNGAAAEAARTAALGVAADLVVYNDLRDMRAGRRVFTLYRDGKSIVKYVGTAALCKNLLRFCV
ncbi:MAG: phosphopantothenoylcysteine decarboxylase [Elusimicrobiota bacterium]|jgi:phosphopantothenoylcysteine decarboxylase/phosphopantothenate--cysteine ligase|nr:phosphopantothenoylcysteine decarboxylase [Elusimicrobiota bacterium]